MKSCWKKLRSEKHLTELRLRELRLRELRLWFEPRICSHFWPRPGDHRHPEQRIDTSLTILTLWDLIKPDFTCCLSISTQTTTCRGLSPPPRRKPPCHTRNTLCATLSKMKMKYLHCFDEFNLQFYIQAGWMMIMEFVSTADKYHCKPMWTQHLWLACTATCRPGRA